MKTIFILLVCCYLSACELMGLHRCDALSGWCVPSRWEYLEHYGWYTKIEAQHKKSGHYRFEMGAARYVEEEKKKKILLSCNIEPNSGEILNSWTEDRAYHCVYKKGLCTSRNGKYKCDF